MPQTSVSTSGVRIVGANSARKSVLFRNGSSSGTVYLDNNQPSAMTTGTAGIQLGPGDAIVVVREFDGRDQLTDEWSAIADASVTLIWKEFFGEER